MPTIIPVNQNQVQSPSEHLQLQGALLDKALSIHEVELTQALNAKEASILNDSARVKDICEALAIKIKASVNTRINIEWVNKYAPLVTLADAFNTIKGKGKKYKAEDLLRDCADEFKAWGGMYVNFYLNYVYRNTQSTVEDVEKYPHSVAKYVNLRTKKIKIFMPLSVGFPSPQSRDDEEVDHHPWIDATANEIAWAKEIEKHMPAINAYDVEVSEISKRIHGVKAQADALKVQVFRKQIAQYQGGGDVLAMLDESIQASVEGKLPELLSI